MFVPGEIKDHNGHRRCAKQGKSRLKPMQNEIQHPTPLEQSVSERCATENLPFPTPKTPAASQLMRRHQSLDYYASNGKVKILPRRRKPIVAQEMNRGTSVWGVAAMKQQQYSMYYSPARQSSGDSWWSRENPPKARMPSSTYSSQDEAQ